MTDEAHEDIFLTALILSNSLERKQRSCGDHMLDGNRVYVTHNI